ncbi:MAG: energy-coupling factor transporter transmembrane component T [Gemmatimonadota bacterium]|jgi:energy-coupling factor transport system permease protein|nr:energy-coupling factor transporter transmembrane component T [Gemmatimonadales bacterium]
MIGYVPGHSPLHRAHPYTPLAAASAVLLLAFSVSTPPAISIVVVAAVALALAGGAARAIVRPMLVLVLPTWLLLLVLHGVLGGDPHFALGPVNLSEPGVRRALVLGGRVTAIVIAFLTALATVSPPRLVEAMTAKGVPFGRIFLLVSTLTLVPRIRARAAQILDAQQCRGLRIGGSPAARLRALVPLVLPLVLGALAEVDEQVLALDSRGASSGARRTALDPPPDLPAERALRWTLAALVIAAYAAKFAGAGA